MKHSSTFKRLLAMALVAVMCLSMLPLSIFAAETATFKKVTTAPSDWSGTYLLVYEAGADKAYVFDGSLSSPDAINNYAEAEISSGTITASTGVAITIEAAADGYLIKTASGKYIYASSDTNTLQSNEDATKAASCPHTLSIEGGNAVIASSAGPHMCFNSASNQMRFRYYKSATYTKQKTVCLYKLDEGGSGGEGPGTGEGGGTPDAPVISTIAEAKAMAADIEGITVKGTVVLVDGRNVAVQDGTGGMNLYFNSAPDGIALGDVIEATGKRGTFNGLEQLTGVSAFTKDGTAELPLNETTIADIKADQNTGALESTRVILKGVTIGAASDDNTPVTLGEDSINIYKCPTPEGVQAGDTVDVIAVISDFMGYQLRVSSAEDITVVTAADITTLTPACEGDLKPGSTLTFTLREGVQFKTQLNGGEWTDSDGTYAIASDLAAGDYTLLVKATEGEKESRTLTLTWTVAAQTETANIATLVTDVSELKAGDQIIIAANGYDYALSTTQAKNYRDRAEITKEGNTATYGEDTQIITLEAGVIDHTFAFHVGDGYLYACSAKDNYLRTETTLSANSSWTVVIDGTTGVATLTAQGENTKNWMLYNNSSPRFTCYGATSNQNPLSIYKLGEAEETGVVLTDTPEHLDKVYLYYPNGGLVLSGTANGSKLTGVAGTVTDGKLEVAEGMVELVVSVDGDGRYSFVTPEGKYLTSGATGNSLSFAEEAGDYSLWTLEEATDGLFVKSVNAAYNDNPQYIEYYRGFTTYSKYSDSDAKIYTVQFYRSGKADSVPVFTPGEPEPTEELTDGTYVLWVNGENKALSSNYGTYYNNGVDVAKTGDELTGYTAAEIWDVTVNEDETITISHGGENLAMATEFSSMTLGEVYDQWALEPVGDGRYYVRNVGRGIYMQWYADKGYWSAYKKSENDNFAINFTPVERQYIKDTSVVDDIAQWSGTTAYTPENTANNTVIYGDKYLAGDMKDNSARFTVVAKGAAAQPYQTTQSTSTGSTNYYMGGQNIGAAAGDYAQFAVNTTGWGGMTLSFRMRATKAAPGSFQLRYSTDGGLTFRNFTTGSYSYAYHNYASGEDETGKGSITDGVAKTSMAAGEYIKFAFDVPGGAENCENLLIRLIPGTERASGTGAISGNIRIDSVVLSGSPIVDDAITGYVTVDPDGIEEDQSTGTELTMTSATPGAGIAYRFNDGAWQTYDPANRPVLPSTPCDLEVKASSSGRQDSVARKYHYAAGTVENVIITPSAAGLFIAEGDKVEVTLGCKTPGVTIYYSLSENGDDFAVYTEGAVVELQKGFGSQIVRAYAVKDGFKDSAVTTRTFTERSSARYNIYFGQLHSHTNISDGAGTITEAFDYASRVENLDFLAVTDHSNAFDNNGTDVNGQGVLAGDGSAISSEWKAGHDAAKAVTDEDFVGLYGFEMTWSGGAPGHMNTFNTPGWQSRTQSQFTNKSTALKNYYEALATVPDSISMFNHPGTTFGDFDDFGSYTEAADQLITLIEVGNGEGVIGGNLYFPSYNYYTRALDKGWHVAPTNNQDNHQGKWGDSNTARSVVLADDLTEAAIYDALRNYRVYATEDNDLSIYYTMNGNIMGTILDTSAVSDTVELKVALSDLTDTSMGTVQVIVNGGYVLAETALAGADGEVSFTVPSSYNYYYIKVIQTDGDIAVTAPVWIGKVEAIGISGLNTATDLTIAGEAQTINMAMFNNEKKSLKVSSVTFTDKATGEVLHTDSTITSVPRLGTASCSFTHVFPRNGIYTVVAAVKGVYDGVEKTYTAELEITVMPGEIVTKIVVDGTHGNDYVTGYYGGNMGNMSAIAAENNVKVHIETEAITEELLADCSLLVVSSPARNADSGNAGPYNASPYEDEFLELVAEYVRGGGSIIVCGIADYQDKKAASADLHIAAQLNKLLSAIGATITINDDEAVDDVNPTPRDTGNYTENYRLYPSVFNMDSRWCEGIVSQTTYDDNGFATIVGQTYSAYSGCSVNLNANTRSAFVSEPQWLVKGHPTTYTIDSDKDDKGGIARDSGEDVIFLACQDTAAGGTIFVASTVFISDFEVKNTSGDSAWDSLPYANRTIYENILGAGIDAIEPTPISEVRKADKGEIFVIEGYVTSGTDNRNTTFFDAIYVQDETGGITVFPYSAEGLALGTKLRITGYTDAYQGDKEIQIISCKALEEPGNIIQPEKMSARDAMDYDTNGGELIQAEGEVVSVKSSGTGVSEFVVKDARGDEARIFIDGYILSGTTGRNELAAIVKEGNTVSAVGLLYMHPRTDAEGQEAVLRVRNCDEIKLIKEAEQKPTEEPTEKPTEKPAETTKPDTGGNADTGDNSVIGTAMLVMAAALVAAALLLADRKRYLNR